jgi:tryptophan synthase alpha chain
LTPLEARLRALRERDQAGLAPFVTAGHLGLDGTVPLLEALARGGACAIELGIPFSDPLADGPAIQRTSEIALSHGAGAAHALESAARFHERHDTPLVLMTPANRSAYGTARSPSARSAGSRRNRFRSAAQERPRRGGLASQGLDTSRLAPTTRWAQRDGTARRRAASSLPSRTGITGDRSAFADELEAIVASVRRVTDVPVGVGFGVSDAARAATVARFADLVIVGAALCETIESARARGISAAVGEAERFVHELSAAAGDARKS